MFGFDGQKMSFYWEDEISHWYFLYFKVSDKTRAVSKEKMIIRIFLFQFVCKK